MDRGICVPVSGREAEERKKDARRSAPRVPPIGGAMALGVHRMCDGKIDETREVWDTLGFLQQIGIVPPG